jgi:receptor expression-enhancing protein 5/6
MLPATRGAEVVYHNVVRPLVGNLKSRPATNPFTKTEGFSTAGTTAPSSFEREL